MLIRKVIIAAVCLLALPAQADKLNQALEKSVAELYDVISGPPEKARDWERFRALFLPEAKMVPTSVDEGGKLSYFPTTPQGYIERSGPFFKENGFFEIGLVNKIERFGPIAHVFTSYAAKRSLDDPEPFMRGINSIQYLLVDGEWKILSIFWTQEREDLPLPAEFDRDYSK